MKKAAAGHAKGLCSQNIMHLPTLLPPLPL